MATKFKERMSATAKNANKQEWYKHKANLLDSQHFSLGSTQGSDAYRSMKVNYDLFNNICDMDQLNHVCNPTKGDMPAKMANRDIVSSKVKSILGMELKRAFPWHILAINDGATTRKEQEETKRMRDYVVSSIIDPIRKEIEMRKAEEAKGQQLTPEDQERINQEVEEELRTQTPEEVKKYMTREHQDPAEIMTTHLLKYLVEKLDLNNKFNTKFKHALLSAKGVMYQGAINGHPVAWNVNSMNFNHDPNPDLSCIEDGEFASCSYNMSPSQLIQNFPNSFTNEEIDRIYESWSGNAPGYDDEDLFALAERQAKGDTREELSGLTAVHFVWRSLRRIGFLSYRDQKGNLAEKMVDEDYSLNTDFGDIKIEWEWVPEIYETWKVKIADPIYLNMQPLPGQFKDIENLYYSKLPYYGVLYDNMNSIPTSLMDRLREYQFYYNVVMFRIDMLMASDKGKKMLININVVNKSGIPMEKWLHYFESTPFMFYDPDEEGSQYNDANTMAKVVDLSLISDIEKYIKIAEYLKTQCGDSTGITQVVEGQIGARDAVTNTKQNLIQTSHILELYFERHNESKKNFLTGLIETAKVAFASSKPRVLSYFLDDMSLQMFTLDVEMLEANTLSLFVSNSIRAQEIKETLEQLTHAAMQNQKVELSDVIAVLRQDSILEAEEVLKVAENNRVEREQAASQNAEKAKAESEEKAREFVREEHAMELEKIQLKADLDKDKALSVAALTGMSFNPETDTDGDGVNDFLEIAKAGLNADIVQRKQKLAEDKFEHEKVIDATKAQNEAKKIKIAQSKNNKK